MSLLREIQELATDSKVSLPVLLRKCKILAARLGNVEFKMWVESELSGYDSKTNLPIYRILKTSSKGHFSGPFGSGLRNADIPMLSIPEALREDLRYSYVKQSVAALESVVETAKSGFAEEAWSADVVAYVGGKIYEDMHCMQAWKVIPIPSIVSALDAIRNRILTFVLEIELEAPDAGDGPLNSNVVSQEKVQQIFNTSIFGNVQNLATGSVDVDQHATYIERDNSELFTKLLDSIAKSNVHSDLIAKLSAAVEEMRANQKSGSFKKHYQTFISLLADHMQVLGPVVAPYLPALSALIS